MDGADAGIAWRDYSLTGPEADRAIATGLASAEWYHSDVPRKEMKALMKRTDGPAMRDTALWIGLLILSAAGGIATWGTWWTVPFWAVYGVLYGSACDSRWHECGHGTAFRTSWMNDAVYALASFMVMRNPVSWRGVWSKDGLCTHEQVHLADGLVMDDTIECPKHNGRFNYKTGAALRSHISVALATDAARIATGRAQVQV